MAQAQVDVSGGVAAGRKSASGTQSRWIGLRAGILAFSAVLVIGVWVAAMLLVQRDQRLALEGAMRANSQLARVFEEHSARSLAEAAQLASVIRSEYLRQGSALDLVQFFKDARSDLQLVQNVLIADETGRMAASSIAGAPSINIADREHFKVHAARDSGQLFIGKPVLTRSGQQWSFIVSLRINKRDGSFGGTVGVALNPAYFAQFYRQIDLGPGGAVNLIGLDGIVRARAAAGGAPEAGQDISGGELFRQIETAAAGSYVALAKIDGVRRVQSYRRMPGYPLIVTVGIAEQVALTQFEAHRTLYFLAALLTTIMIGAAAITLHGSIARQQRSAAALESAGARLLEAQELAGMLSLEWTVDSDQVDWSRSPAFLLGPKPAEGYPLYRDMVHPDDRACWLAERQAALASNESTHYSDYRLIRTDGALRWVSCAQRAPLQVDGVRRASFTLLDISARKEAEFALAQSEGRLRELTQNLEAQIEQRTGEIRAREGLLHMVTENIPVMIGYYDAGLHLRFANSAFARHVYAEHAPQAVGMHISALLPAARWHLLEPYLRRVLAGDSQQLELPHLRDPARTTEVTFVPDRRADGSVAGVFLAQIDITARKEAEQTLRAVDERYRAVVTNMAEGIVVRDHDGTVIDCNPSAEHILGRTRAEICGGQNMAGNWDVIGEDGLPVAQKDRSAHKAMYSGQLQPPQVLGFRRPDGSLMWLSMTSTPVLDSLNSKVRSVFTTFVDITRRKEVEAARDALEAQLRESQKMEAMGTLAGGIAHDFNNILGAILGNVALARDDVGTEHVARQSIDEIGKAGERAKRLVQQILAFSRKQPQQFARVQMHSVVDETLAMLRATLPAGIRIDAHSSGAPCVVHADATQMGQVLMNLCTNAWHAVSDAGHAGMAGAIAVRLDEITLDTAGALRFGAVAPGVWVRLTVSDAGKGMDAATQARMFEPFFTTRQVGEGTGLGLAVAHGIVRSHHGAIAVSSAPGKGTVFEVIVPAWRTKEQGARDTPALVAASEQDSDAALPVAAAPAPASVTASVPLSGTSSVPPSVPSSATSSAPSSATSSAPSSAPVNRHVLYLDDEPSMVFLVQRMLTKLGYRVSAFERPADALAAVRADAASFDVVVTDFNMPGKSGLEVAREIGQMRADLPVVIASGYITDELRAGAELLGVRDLIYKPNTVDDLCQAIARVLQPGRAG